MTISQTFATLLEAHRWRKDRAAVVLLSGGMDSTLCAHIAGSIYPLDRIAALVVDYGQSHRDNEIYRACEVADTLKIRWHRLCLADAMHALRPAEMLANAAHNSNANPHPATIPARNSILLSIAAAHGCTWFAQQIDIWMGACADDAKFTDCRREYIAQKCIELTYACGRGVSVAAPLLEMTKRTIVSLAASNPTVLSAVKRSWSCYRGGASPCGACTPCVLRADAFAHAGQGDEQRAPMIFGGDPHREVRP